MKDRRSASAKPEVGPPLPAVEETLVNDDQYQHPIAESLLAQVLEQDNLVRALQQVKRNKGAAGVDGMTVDQLPAYLKQHWRELREQLLNGSYQPQAVKRVEIPKADGRKRKLGIPTVVDRFIQQAVAQVLSRQWEPDFHPHSYGIAAVDSKHQIVIAAQVIGEGQEQHSLQPVLVDIKDRFNRLKISRNLYKEGVLVTADTGYANEANMEYLKTNGIDAYTPDNQFRSRDPKFADHKGKYAKKPAVTGKPWDGAKRASVIPASEFAFDANALTCRCPEGNLLGYRDCEVAELW